MKGNEKSHKNKTEQAKSKLKETNDLQIKEK
jgi:hypothetical protein